MKTGSCRFRLSRNIVSRQNLIGAVIMLAAISIVSAQVDPIGVELPPLLTLSFDRALSHNGEYQLNWSPSPSEGGYDYVRIEQRIPIGDEIQISEHVAEGESIWFIDYPQGVRALSARACRMGTAGEICGPSSTDAQVDMSAQAMSVRTTYTRTGLPEPVAGATPGSLDFAPGIYQSSFARNNAWSLYWKNNLGRDAEDPLFGNIYDLVVLWVTFRDMAPPGQTPNLLPTYLIGVLQKNGSIWSGSLTRPIRHPDGSTSSAIVGNLNISMRQEGGRSLPTVQWRVTDSSFYRNGNISWISDPLQWSPTQFGLPEDANPVDHYQGFWVPPNDSPVHGQGIGLASVIIGAFEGQTVLFLDAAGEPAWATGFRDGRPNNPGPAAMTEWCVNTAVAGDFPDGPDQDGAGSVAVSLGCNPSSQPTTNGNLGREYLPLVPGPSLQSRYWANFVLPPESSRSGSVNIGSQFSPLPMDKAANFHMIRQLIADSRLATQCIKGTDGLCRLKLVWFSDGTYPQTRAYLRNTVSNALTFVGAGWPAVEDFNHAISVTGSYRYELWRDSNTSSSGQRLAISRTFEVLSNPGPESAPNPAANPNPPEDLISTRVGATTGEFRVDESGGASYSIPILTAPAGGGMAPQLALTYSSHAGNGIAGMGWSLSGLSMISRCGPSVESGDVQNGGLTISPQDRFCLDGQRLVLVSGVYGGNGAEYRTELDSIARIQSFGAVSAGPAWFKVWRKDGSISWYGAISDSGANHSSRIMSKLVGGGVFSWAMGRIQDSAGNYMDFDWQDSHPGNNKLETVLAAVRYGGHATSPTLSPNNSIELSYQSRPATDQTSGWVAGVEMVSTRRLTQIRSLADGQELRRYNLNYRLDGDGAGRSALASIQECNSTTCYPATTFDWKRGDVRLGALSASGFIERSLPNLNRIVSQQPGDINGDGLVDYVYLEKQSSSSAAPQFKWVLSQRSGFGVVSFTSVLGSSAMGGGVRSDADFLPKWQFIDINADGFNDIVYAYHNTDTGVKRFYAHRWTGSGFAAAQIFGSFIGSATGVQVLDFDGDGLADLMYQSGQVDPYGGSSGVRVARNTGYNPANPATTLAENTGFTVQLSLTHFPRPPAGWTPTLGQPFLSPLTTKIFDANGDGHADVVMQVTEEYCNTNLPGNSCTVLHPEIESNIVIIDDTDERGDEEITPIVGGSTAFRSRFILFEMQGNSLVSREMLALAGNDAFGGSVSKADELRITDLNADGLADVIYFSPNLNRWEFRLNSGNLFSGVQSINHWPSDNEIRQHFQLADVNADGLPDGLFPSSAASASAVWRVSAAVWNNGNLTFGTLQSTGAQTSDLRQGAASQFVDFNGDGKVDQLLIKPNGTNLELRRGWGRNSLTGLSTYEPLFLIDRFTDGFGAWNQAIYKSLVQRSVYTRDTDGPHTGYGMGSVVYDVVAPQYVVSEARSLSPHYEVNASATGSTARLTGSSAIVVVQYYYTGAKIQGGGRGFLGFREVATFDPQSSITTRTRYRQDFPFIGMPDNTVRWFISTGQQPWLYNEASPALPPCASSCANNAIRSGILLSDAQNIWSELTTAGAAALTYLSSSVEKSYTPVITAGTITSSQFISRVTTSNSAVDQYGNVGTTIASTYATVSGGSSVLQQVTTNLYNNTVSSALWHLGRLTQSTVEHDRRGGSCTASQFGSGTDALCIRRMSSFGYDSATGILNRETVEPNDTQLKVDTNNQLDAFGNRVSTTVSGFGISTRSSSVTYDSRGRYIVSRSNAYNQITEQNSGFDRYGNPTQVKDLTGVTTTIKYDQMGREFFRYSPTGAWVKQTLRTGTGGVCPSGTQYHRQSTAAGAPTSWTCFDPLGREVRRVDTALNGQRRQSDTRYDESGRVAEVSEPYYTGQSVFWTRTLYDEIGRPLLIRQPDGGANNQSYSGLSTTFTNPLGQKRTETRNVLGERVSVTDYVGTSTINGTIIYSYDAVGNLLTTDGVLAGTSDRVTMNYDRAGRKIAMSDPDKGNWSYRYDVLGQLICQQDAKGQLTVYSYDKLGRETLRRHYSNGSVASCSGSGSPTASFTWTYDLSTGTGTLGKRGQLTADSATHNGFAQNRSYIYDGFGRLTGVSTAMDGQSWFEETTYDQFGRLFQQFDAAGDELNQPLGVRYVYNGNGHLSQLKEAANGSIGKVYVEYTDQDARGQISQTQYGNGLSTDRLFDPRTGLVQWIGTSGFGSAVQDLSYTFDMLGNLIEREQNTLGLNQTEVFGYDGLNRLKTVRLSSTDLNVNNQLTLSMSYDRSGNITSKSGVGSYQYLNGSPHAVSRAGSTNYNYDLNGNVTSDTSGRTFTYTAFERLSRASKGANWSQYYYAPDLNWVKRQTQGADAVNASTETIWRIGNVEIVEKNGIRELKRTIGGEVQISHWSNGNQRERYLHKDHLGSIDSISNINGFVTERMSFGAFGERRLSRDWRFGMGLFELDALREITSQGYTGHEMVDAVGIIHMGGRIYDPRLGRFLQADPFVQAPDNSQNLNRYTYVLNNPLSFIDPSGFFFGKLFRKLGKVLTIAGQILQLFPNETAQALGRTLTTIGAVLTTIGQGISQGTVAFAFNKVQFIETIESNQSFDVQMGDSSQINSVSDVLSGVQWNFGHLLNFSGSAGLNATRNGDTTIAYKRQTVSISVGNTASSITNGKFSNGAGTDSFVYALGILKFLGPTLGDAGIERGRQDALVRQLDPIDSAGRSSIKNASRARTPFLAHLIHQTKLFRSIWIKHDHFRRVSLQ